MTLKTLLDRPDLNPGQRTQARIQNFSELLFAIGELDLPLSVVQALNLKIEAINQMQGTEKEYRKALVNTEYNILKFLEKEHKIVPKHHYQKTCLAIGMALFRIPIGVAMGAALVNMGFIGVGIGIGLAIGIATGSAMDKIALKEGHQLEFEARI
jgi:hypothetical protein